MALGDVRAKFVHNSAEIRIGSEKLILDEELKAPTFFLVDSGIEWRAR